MKSNVLRASCTSPPFNQKGLPEQPVPCTQPDILLEEKKIKKYTVSTSKKQVQEKMFGGIKQAITDINRHINRTLILFVVVGSVSLALLFYLVMYIFFNRFPGEHELSVAAAMIAGNILFFILLRIIITKRISAEFEIIDKELYFINLIKDHTSEFVIILNEYGQIINHNNAFTEALHLDHKSIIGKPLREIFSLSELDQNLHYRQLILDKLKTAFQGQESELISTVFIKKKKDIQTIYLKLNPIMQNGDLEHIFVTGRLFHTDFITNQWLTTEQSNYIVSNDLSLIHLFSYRLTRNLDGKLPRNEILYMQIALQEVLINAIEHGNLEIDFSKKTELKQMGGNYWELLTRECDNEHLSTRKVFVDYKLSSEGVLYTIQDEGGGFNWNQYMTEDPETRSSKLIQTFHGVGLQMIQKSFDSITFNEKGNQIILEKKLPGAITDVP